ncbi:hypothetical protein C0992_005110 [Termitomyces sp. T32_za158]|nr:hypothetical protein C0992_005110 [Termitomyces sp. T32_za158]
MVLVSLVQDGPLWFPRQASTEEIDQVLRTLSLRDIGILSGTSIRPYVYAYMANKFSKSLMSFGFPPNEFLRLLHNSRSVVSGSFVLNLLLPEGACDAADLDMYVPSDGRSIVYYHLINTYGYTVDLDPVEDVYSRDTCIADVVRFRRDGRVVDLVVSITNNSLDPIVNFHSTVVWTHLVREQSELSRTITVSDSACSPKAAPIQQRWMEYVQLT